MNSIVYFQRMKQFFIKEGKKNAMEKIFRTFLMNRATSKKENLTKILYKAQCNSTPHVRLRTRRRGRRILYKVTYIEEEKRLKKALLSFSKNLKENKNPKFLISLEKDLETLSSGKSSITTKRDEFHRLALKHTPYSWTRKRKKKEDKLQAKKFKFFKGSKRFKGIKN